MPNNLQTMKSLQHCLQISLIVSLYYRWIVTEASSFDTAPWQSTPDSRSRVEESVYLDLPPTVFSPSGRLHSLETVVQAASLQGNLVLAMNCQNGTVIVSTVTLSPYLNYTQFLVWNDDDDEDDNNFCTTVPIFDLSPHLVAATAGNNIHGQVMKSKLHSCCQSLLKQQQEHIQAGQLARFVADQLQVPTQTVGGKSGDGLLQSFCLIVGNGELWRVDPTGQFWKCQAAVIGKSAIRAEEELYKQLQNTTDWSSLSTEEALKLLLNCLETTTTPKTPGQSSLIQPSTKTFWQAVVLENSKSTTPQRRIRRGAFLPKKTKNSIVTQ